MASFLALLPRSLTTFLFALAALLRFYGNTETEFFHVATLRWSFLAFCLGSAALVANLGLEWNAGNRSRNREAEGRERANEKTNRADEERNRANQERERAARRARVQNRWIILQVQYQVAPREATRTALGDFVVFLQEYGE